MYSLSLLFIEQKRKERLIGDYNVYKKNYHAKRGFVMIGVTFVPRNSLLTSVWE